MTADRPDKAALLAALGGSEAGLTSAEAQRRLRSHGPNQISFHHRRSALKLLLQEFTALFPLLLAAGLSLVAHRLNPTDGYDLIAGALLLVVLLNATVSFIQNFRVEKLMVSLLDYIPKRVILLRDGEQVLRDACELVPGDLLFIQEGDKVPADGVLIAADSLLLDESVLTGESEPLAKEALTEIVGPACEVSSGATVLGGHAAVLVTRTGFHTRLGRISRLSQGVARDLTPMQRELKAFVQKITWLALGIGLLFFLIGLLIGNPFWTNLVFAIGIIVANVPEGLLPTVTLALTQSSMRMGARNALVKDILSVETLGSTTVICTDKTGTLTQNRLHVERLYLDLEDHSARDWPAFARGGVARPLLEAMALCNDVVVLEHEKGRERLRGDPTETALVEFADRHTRLEGLRARFPPLASQPFDARRKYMWSRFSAPGGDALTLVKGAPEVIIARCDRVNRSDGEMPLSAALAAELAAQAKRYADQGLRVLSLARRRRRLSQRRHPHHRHQRRQGRDRRLYRPSAGDRRASPGDPRRSTGGHGPGGTDRLPARRRGAVRPHRPGAEAGHRRGVEGDGRGGGGHR